MKTVQRNAGFGVVEIILIVVILAIIGLIGYRVWDANMNKVEPVTTEQTQKDSQDNKDGAPQINSAEDLDKAEAALDEAEVEGNSEAELNEQTNF